MKALSTLPIALPLALALTSPAATARQVIVELADPPAAHHVARQRARGITVSDSELQALRDELAADQDSLLSTLASNGVAYTVTRFDVPTGDGTVTPIEARYTLVFNGIAMDLPDAAIDQVRSLPQVRDVHPVAIHRPLLNRSVPYINAPGVYGGVAETGPFDDLREGFEGYGINVAVIDTGIEWSHEMFGGDPTAPRFGLMPSSAAVATNEKVSYYLPLFDAVVDTFGHGTHVASTAAGYLGYAPGPDGIPLTADDEAGHGVAPQAGLMGYQVCNGIGSASATVGCLGSAIMMALEDAVSPRTLTGQAKPIAHVINLSLGGSGGPDDATANAADNAALMGAIVVAAAGNDGPGEGTLGSPAAGQHVIAVAASNDAGVYPNRIDVIDAPVPPIVAVLSADSNGGLAYTSPITGRYVYAGLADTPDQVPLAVAGNICLVERGSSHEIEAADQGTGLFAVKAANCESRGAVATVVFNDTSGPIGGVLAPGARPVFTISGEDGQLLLDLGFDAAGVSSHQVRLGTEDPSLFTPMITGFSSRGPVLGLGQVKPDVAAPGEAIMAATTPLGVPVLSMQSATRYIAANGTSMATPHVAGAAALLKQAHPTWTPDMVRTALMNTATNPRGTDGVPQADGLDTANIVAQGSGLIDVAEALNVRALMGVTGDGVQLPGILGSHSFGGVPVVNSRVTHTETAPVVIRDLSGEGGTWTLAVANNRDLQLAGIDVSLSTTSITVPAGGQAGFAVSATVDGDRIRDTFAAKVVGNAVFFEPIQLQWFVTARRTDGAETLRMPFFLRPTATVPAQVQSVETETFADLLPASDTGLQLAADVTYKDFEVEVGTATYNLVGDLTFDAIGADIPDLDLFLLDPSGEEVASSTNAGGPEHLSYRISSPGTYTWRVVGWANAPTEFELVSSQELGGSPPAIDPIVGEFVRPDGTIVDFDGAFTLSWQPEGAPVAFEVERAIDGGDFEVIAVVKPTVTTLDLTAQPAGELQFRVTAMFPGQIGVFPSAPSETAAVTVAPRTQQDITATTDTTISNVSFGGGIFAFDLQLINQAAESWLPLVEMNIVSISSASGRVEAVNADNGGDGVSAVSAALYDYSYHLGADGLFNAGETSERRRLEFANPAGELFTFQAQITGYVGDAGASSTDTGTSSATAGSDDPLAVTQLLEFTVNPLTRSVVVNLVDVLP